MSPLLFSFRQDKQYADLFWPFAVVTNYIYECWPSPVARPVGVSCVTCFKGLSPARRPPSHRQCFVFVFVRCQVASCERRLRDAYVPLLAEKRFSASTQWPQQKHRGFKCFGNKRLTRRRFEM